MFSTLSTERVHVGRSPVTGVRVSRDANGKVGFAIGQDIAALLGMTKGDRVDVLWGSGDDHGLVRIQREPEGRYKLSMNGKRTLRPSPCDQPDWLPKCKVGVQQAVIADTNGRSVTLQIPAALLASEMALAA